MSSKRWGGVILGALLTLAPVPSSAATITMSIGSFTWDPSFLGDSFSLQNDSALFEGLAGDFSDVSLLLTPDYDLDNDQSPDAPFGDFATSVGFASAGNSYNQTYEGPFSSARLQFRFAPTGLPGLPELMFDRSFSSPDDPFFASPFINYSYDVADPDPGPDPAPVPEPSTLLLLGSAIAAAALKRCRARRAARAE